MKSKGNFLMIFLTGVLLLLAACENSSDVSEAPAKKQSSNSSSTQNADRATSNEDTATEKNLTENGGEGAEDARQSDKEDLSKNSKKEEYLKKLNEMEEADKHTEAKTTISDMEEQEEERYKKWDKVLNEVYGVLKEQLSNEQVDLLREEQRKWIEYRDEAAKEASLEYKGGSMESLEYIATQARLTKERAYKLVANHMK